VGHVQKYFTAAAAEDLKPFNSWRKNQQRRTCIAAGTTSCDQADSRNASQPKATEYRVE
jgi:hypothetical protein